MLRNSYNFQYFKLTVLKSVFISLIVIVYCGSIFSQQQSNSDRSENSFKSVLEINFENEFNSNYLFRGLTVEDNFVYQPALYVWYGKEDAVNKFGSGIWFNFRMPHKYFIEENPEAENNSYTTSEPVSLYKPFKLSETDLYLMHQAEIEDLTFKNTAAFYLFAGNDFENTAEYIFNFTYLINEKITKSELTIGSELAVDLYAAPGAFIMINSLSLNKEITQYFSFNTSFNLIWASAKYNYVNADVSKTALNSAGIDASMIFSPSEIFYTKLRCQYNRYIDGIIVEKLGYNSFSLGLTAGFNL